MQTYQKQFIELAIASKALGFGAFTLKSGRVSPYFFNAGRLCHGAVLVQLGRCYAQTIVDAGIAFDVLLGPAYKGIPLAAVTACALATDFDLDVPFVYNRKEAKDHGEGGILVGPPFVGQRVLVIDDVMTAGTAVRGIFRLIEQAGAHVAGVVVGLDRQERGQGEQSATVEIAAAFAVPVVSIIRLDHIINYLQAQPDNKDDLEKMEAYRQHYGVTPP